MIRPKREDHLGEHFSMSSKLVHVATDLKMQSTSRTMLPSECVVNFVFDLIRFKKETGIRILFSNYMIAIENIIYSA